MTEETTRRAFLQRSAALVAGVNLATGLSDVRAIHAASGTAGVTEHLGRGHGKGFGVFTLFCGPSDTGCPQSSQISEVHDSAELRRQWAIRGYERTIATT